MLGFRVRGLGLRVQGLGLRVHMLRFSRVVEVTFGVCTGFLKSLWGYMVLLRKS